MLFVFKESDGTQSAFVEGLVINKPISQLRMDRFGNQVETVRVDLDTGFDQVNHMRKKLPLFVQSAYAVRVAKHLKINERVLAFGIMMMNYKQSNIYDRKMYYLMTSTLIPMTQIYKIIERLYKQDVAETMILAEYDRNRRKSEKAQSVNYGGGEEKEEFFFDPDFLP